MFFYSCMHIKAIFEMSLHKKRTLHCLQVVIILNTKLKIQQLGAVWAEFDV
jgi:hypothetical protein